MSLQVFHHPACRAHGTQGHVERPERLAAAEAGIRAADVPQAWHEAAPVDEAMLAHVHAPAHVAAVRRACERGAWIDADTYTTPASWGAALAAAGCALDAARAAARGEMAFALPRPPGHHATPERAMGFCLFSNVAVAADALAREGRRVAVVDVDVHHGNGTQDAFYDRGDVLFASLHGWPLYPGTGAVEQIGAGAGVGATLNLPLPSATGAAGWIEAFEGAVMPAVEAFAPDVVLVSLGFDGDHRDPLGNLLLAPSVYYECITSIRRACGRIAAVLEGGYDLDALREGAHAAAAALAGAPMPAGLAPAPEGARPWPRLRERVARAHPRLALR